jgi:hypothetical protein
LAKKLAKSIPFFKLKSLIFITILTPNNLKICGILIENKAAMHRQSLHLGLEHRHRLTET